MNDQIKKTLAPLKQFWSGSEKGMQKRIALVAVAIIALAAGLSFFLNIKDYVVIYDQLNAVETSEILSQLQQMNIDVKLDAQGAVMVPKNDESKVRMALAQAGYPRSGLSYYMIEQGSGLLATDFERQQYVNMQLQERIAASIKTLDGVRDAIVTITVPEESVFYLYEKEPPTASVIIHMNRGTVLGDSQVAGIQNLVIKAVSGLTRENVAISDSSGNSLSAGAGDSSDVAKISITRQIESDIQKKVMGILEGPYGRSNIRISVTATVDTDELYREERTYTPSPDGDNRGVISQEMRSEESSSSPLGDGGIPGTDSNTQIPTYPVEGELGASVYSNQNESTTYLVNQSVSQFQKDGARIEAVSIGIAIDKATFEPDERERIQSLVAYAVGIAPEHIAVENFRFYVPEFSDSGLIDEIPGGLNLVYLMAGVAALLILIISLVAFLLRRKKKAALALASANNLSRQEAIDELFGQESLKQIEPVRDTRKEQIKDFASTNPEIAAQMIRSWLKSDN